ncbi:MAG: hypothetical protein FJ038_14075, partial [Chloroflexi bacterium]|nr:hypothetical protein [Chloroflexota bacterium]
MTERGYSLGVALACPFVAFDDERDERSDRPSPRHRCYAETPPSTPAREHQEQHCLSAGFAGCPVFQIWARREAARVQHPSLREEPDVRLREPGASPFPSADEPSVGTPRFASAPRFGEGPAEPAAPELTHRPVQQGTWSQPPAWLQSSGGAQP